MIRGILGIIWCLIITLLIGSFLWHVPIEYLMHSSKLALISWLGAYLLRLIRLLILSMAIHRRVKDLIITHSTSVMAGALWPWPLGDIMRMASLSLFSQKITHSIVIIGTERLLDAIVLLGIISLLIVSGHEVTHQPLVVLVLILVTMALCILVGLSPFIHYAQGLLLSQSTSKRGIYAMHFLKILHQSGYILWVVSNRRQLLLLALSLGIWTLELMAVYWLVGSKQGIAELVRIMNGVLLGEVSNPAYTHMIHGALWLFIPIIFYSLYKGIQYVIWSLRPFQRRAR
jgi:hypothetical protein